MIIFCKICNTEFFPRPSHIKRGWGVFCSRNCKNIGTRVRQEVSCSICSKRLFKTVTQIRHSKSGKYFCNKSCQTKWRNKEFSGIKSKIWKDGTSTYRNLISSSEISKFCFLCKEGDLRILAVHHVDKNRKNNNIENLAWLCHNCHSLVHYGRLEGQRFLIKHRKNLAK